MRERFLRALTHPDDVLVWLLGLQMVSAFYSIAASSVLGGTLVLVFLIGSARSRTVELFRLSRVYPVLAIAIWLPITLLWSRNIPSGVDELKNLWFYLLFLTGVLVDWNERRIKIVIFMFIFGAVSNFLVALLQMKGLWPLGGYDPVQGPVGYSYRVFLGVDTAPIIVLMIRELRSGFLFQNKIYPLLIALVLTIQLMITTGRTGQAVFLVLLFPALFIIFNDKKKLLLQLLAGCVAFVVLVSMTVPSVGLRWHDALRDVFMFFSGHPSTDVGLRMVYWDSALHIFAAHPLFGIGPGSFIGYTKNLLSSGVIPAIPHSDYWTIEPHNSFLAYLTSYGLVGLLLLLAFLTLIFREIWPTRMSALGFFRLFMFLSFVIGSFSDVMIFRFAVVAPFMVAMAMQYSRE